MTTVLPTLALVLLLAASAAAQQPPATRVLTNEGSILNGTIAGGTVTLKTTFGGDVRIDPRRIQSLVGNTLTLDDGSVVHGTLSGGVLQLGSAFGTLSIPVERITEIQHLKGKATASPAPATPSTAPAPLPTAPPATAATPPARAATIPAKPATAAVQIVNETRRNLSVCVNDETPCLSIGPNASTTKTIGVGQMRLRVESTTQLGFVVLATGNFERSVAVDKDTIVRVTESDFR